MTARTLRRAAERKAAKLARQETNRQNAKLSTGPRTEEGKAISSMNAVKTGLTGRTVLLPSDDRSAYREHVAGYENVYQPEGLRERELVQAIADAQWRLQRIPVLEAAIYDKGREEFAEEFGELDPERRAARVALETTLRYERSLRNLHLQECRLRRHREKDLAELKALQASRRKEADVELPKMPVALGRLEEGRLAEVDAKGVGFVSRSGPSVPLLERLERRGLRGPQMSRVG